MSKIIIDTFVTPELITGATADKPKAAVIKSYRLVEAKDLPFASEDDRHELNIEIDGEEYSWLPNKTTLKAFAAAFTNESDKWIGKKIGLYLVDQNVSGTMRKIVYGAVSK